MRIAAKAAHDAGQGVFAPTLVADGDWGAAIEVIESAGWTLQHWSVAYNSFGSDQYTNSTANAFPVFRRAN